MRYGRNRTTPARTTTSARPSFMSRFRRRPAHAEGTTASRRDHRTGVEDGHHAGGLHFGTHGGTTAPVHHHKRNVTLGDKISGAMMKLRGSLTHRPGQKAAGTRRMQGTDGRGSRAV